MAELAVAITLIALPDSLNPSLLLTELVLAGGPHPRRDTAVFTLVAMATTFAGGLALALGLGDLVLAVVPKPSATLRNIIIVAIGAALAVAGAVLWSRRDRAATQIDTERALHRAAALLGLGIAGVELATAFPYFAAIAAILGADLGPARDLFLLVLFNACFVLPLLAIVGTLTFAPGRSDRLLCAARTFLHRHWPTVFAGLALAAGLFVVLLGVTGLGASHSRFLRHLHRTLHG